MSGENNTENRNCCSIGAGPPCMCLPYGHGLLIAAQVLSICAFVLSWIWWVVFLVSLIVLIFYQTMWCCRLCKAGIIVASSLATLAGIVSLITGIIMILEYSDGCFFLIFFEVCNGVRLAIVAFVQSALWFACAACSFTFVFGGQHERMETKWVEKFRTGNVDVVTVSAVEMGNIHPTEQVAEENR